MMVNLARDLRGMIRHQEAGIWERAARFQSDLTGKTVGIWGYGGIGRETARLAKALGMTVHALGLRVGPRPLAYVIEGTGDPEGKLPDRIFRPEQKTEFLGGLDFLVLSMPLTQKTKGLPRLRGIDGVASAGLFVEPGPRAAHSRGGAAQGVAGRQNRRGGAGHALLLPDACRSSLVEISECHYDSAHQWLDSLPVLPVTRVGSFPPECSKVPARARRCSTN